MQFLTCSSGTTEFWHYRGFFIVFYCIQLCIFDYPRLLMCYSNEVAIILITKTAIIIVLFCSKCLFIVFFCGMFHYRIMMCLMIRNFCVCVCVPFTDKENIRLTRLQICGSVKLSLTSSTMWCPCRDPTPQGRGLSPRAPSPRAPRAVTSRMCSWRSALSRCPSAV